MLWSGCCWYVRFWKIARRIIDLHTHVRDLGAELSAHELAVRILDAHAHSRVPGRRAAAHVPE